MPLTRNVRRLPPPKGLNRSDPVGGLGPDDAVHLINMVRGSRGLRSRLGWREFCRPDIEACGPIRSLAGFTGTTAGDNRLFAFTKWGISDITAGGTTPVLDVSWGTQETDLAGYGTSAPYNTLGDRYLFFADEENGLHRYKEDTDAWTALTEGSGENQIDGVDPANLDFCMVWKNRLWFIEKNSPRAWYLPIGQVEGEATCFNFGTKLKLGGNLVGMWSWTTDGGIGLDDLLVVVSSSGDVVVYQGTDPDSASSFGLKGMWQVGSIPAGRRIASDCGGDLLLLTGEGVLSMAKLIGGSDKLDPQLYGTQKIQPLFAEYMETTRSTRGWSLVQHPEESVWLVLTPKADEQFALSSVSGGWSHFKEIPIYRGCAAVWSGKLYFGTEDSRVCIADGAVDALELEGTGSTEINWAFLQGYYDLGSPDTKQVGSIVSYFLTDGLNPGFETSIRYDFDCSEPAFVSVPATGYAALWGTAVWDSSVWPAKGVSLRTVRGATGSGRFVALELSGSSTNSVTFIGSELLYTVGNSGSGV